jgi:hypothetical protein
MLAIFSRNPPRPLVPAARTDGERARLGRRVARLRDLADRADDITEMNALLDRADELERALAA